MSSSVLVYYVIQGDEDDPETGVQSSFYVDRPSPPRALTLSRLRESFPFEGTFHFRLKVPDDSGLSKYCWIDLTTEGDDVIELARNLGGLEGNDGSGAPHQQRLHLKVLPLGFGSGPGQNEETPTGAFTGGGVFGAEGAERDGYGLGVGETEEEYLAGGVSGLNLGGGASFDAREEYVARTSREAATETVEGDGVFDPESLDRQHQHRFETASSAGGLGSVSRDRDDDREASVYGESGRRGEELRGGRGGEYGDEEEDATWKASVVNQASQGVKDLQKKTSQVAKTMGFSAKKMWNAINKGVSGGVPPSEEAMENLQELGKFLGTTFSATNQDHIMDLEKVWNCLYPDDQFEGAESPLWKEAGFQEANVAGDFRGTGVLALKSMVFFCQNYERKAAALCLAQSRGSSSHYPWAVVANNITLMLADVLELRANQFEGSRKGYWGVFDRRAAYFEIFCMAFRLLDYTWIERGATRTDFGQIIGYTKSVIEQLLESNPPTLPAFMVQAEEMGMLR